MDTLSSLSLHGYCLNILTRADDLRYVYSVLIGQFSSLFQLRLLRKDSTIVVAELTYQPNGSNHLLQLVASCQSYSKNKICTILYGLHCRRLYLLCCEFFDCTVFSGQKIYLVAHGSLIKDYCISSFSAVSKMLAEKFLQNDYLV